MRVPDERLIEIIKPEEMNHLRDPVPTTVELLRSNESFVRKAGDASRVCIVLGFCGTQQTTVELTQTVLKFISNPQNSTTILCTAESPELDPSLFGASRVLRHTSKSETATCGPLKNGFVPQVSSDFLKAELRVLIGELRPHQFLGYAGLSDLIFPSLGSNASITAHLAERGAYTLDDLHKERLEIAHTFDNTFALGLGLDAELQASSVVFDTFEGSLASLEPIVSQAYLKQITNRADILVMSAGGAPFDSTLDRSVESFPVGINALKRDGALIVAAECEQGHGGGRFYEWCTEHKEPRYLESRLRHHFSYDGFKAAFLGRTLQSHRVYLVSTIPDHYVESVFDMKPAPTVNAALQSAQRTHGSQSMISVIPNALRVTSKLIEAEKE